MKRSDAPWAEALVRRRWFRLRLFALGAAAGVAAGLTVSLYRFLIGQAESCRAVLAAVTADAAAGGQYLPALAWAAGCSYWPSCWRRSAGGSLWPREAASLR